MSNVTNRVTVENFCNGKIYHYCSYSVELVRDWAFVREEIFFRGAFIVNIYRKGCS